MGSWYSKRGVQVASFVTSHQLQQIAFVASQYALNPPDKLVKFLTCAHILVIVDSVEFQEQRYRRPQLGQETVRTYLHAVIHRRQDPGANLLLGELRAGRPGSRFDCIEQTGHDGETAI